MFILWLFVGSHGVTQVGERPAWGFPMYARSLVDIEDWLVLDGVDGWFSVETLSWCNSRDSIIKN